MEFYKHVFDNIKEFIKYRYNVDYKDTGFNEQAFRADEYTKIHIPSTTILLFNDSSTKYKSINAETRKLIKDNIKGKKELILIMNKDIEEMDINDYPDVWVQVRRITTFYINVPRCKQIPRHTREADQDSIQKSLSGWYTNTKSIPRISLFDPPVVWLGARKGDIISVDRPSVSSGYQTIYRVVV